MERREACHASASFRWFQERSIDLDAARSLNETILAASPVGIAVYRQEGRCVSINAVCSRILGHAGPPPALEADPFWRRTGLPARARKPLETGGMASGECRVGPNDDAPWIDWQTVRFIREGVHHLLLLVTDITERKRAEEQLRRIGAVLTSMLVNLPLDFWARDREGRLIIQSDISRAVWGDLRGMGETVPTVDDAVRRMLEKAGHVEKAALRDVLSRAVTGAGPAIFSFALFCVASFYISC